MINKLLAVFLLSSFSLVAQIPANGTQINTILMPDPVNGSRCITYNQIRSNPVTGNQWQCVNALPNVQAFGVWTQTNNAGAGGTITSVFGRSTPAIIAQASDYSAFYDATGAAATAQTNAQTFASNASNLSNGTIPSARVPVLNQSTTGNATTATGTNGVTCAADGLHALTQASTTFGCTTITVTGSSVHTASAYFDGGGSALTAGKTVYAVANATCAAHDWSILVDAGTATVDVWKITSTTALPTVTNTITASAVPAIATGTKAASSTLTGWTTAVTAGDVIAINLKVVATATIVQFALNCQ